MTFSRTVAPTVALAFAAASLILAQSVPQPKPVWLILVDDFHIQFKSTGHLRGLVRRIASDVIQEGEEFTVTLSSGKTSLSRTSARERVDSFARDLSGMGLRSTDTAQSTSEEVAYREGLTLQEASRLLDSVAQETNRSRRLIVVSNGWSSGPEGQLVHTLTTHAKALAIPIVTIDPQQFVRNGEPNSPADPKVTALLATTAASLRAVAERTGGLAILDSGELNEVLGLVRKAFKLPGNPA